MARNVEVRCHSGYKGEEYPESFVYEGREYEVAEILEQFLEEDLETRERRRVFFVKTDNGSKFRLIHSEDSEAWYCSIGTTDGHR